MLSYLLTAKRPVVVSWWGDVLGLCCWRVRSKEVGTSGLSEFHLCFWPPAQCRVCLIYARAWFSGNLFAISSKLVDYKHVLRTGKYASFIVSALQFPKNPMAPSPINHSMERPASSLTSSAFLHPSARFRKPFPIKVSSAWNQAVWEPLPSKMAVHSLYCALGWRWREVRLYWAWLGLMQAFCGLQWGHRTQPIAGCSPRVPTALGLPQRRHTDFWNKALWVNSAVEEHRLNRKWCCVHSLCVHTYLT